MRKFQFTLQAVLTLRQEQEQQAMTRYGEALLARAKAVEQLENVERTLMLARREWIQESARVFFAEKMLQFQSYERALLEQRKQAVGQVALAERKVNQALQSMMLARQQREVVDKFHERQKAGHEQELLRDEQKMLDELAGCGRASAFAFKG